MASSNDSLASLLNIPQWIKITKKSSFKKEDFFGGLSTSKRIFSL